MKKSLFKSWALAATALLCGAFSAQAGDFGAMQLDQTYVVLDDWQDWYGTYTADFTGVLYASSDPSATLFPFTDANYENQIEVNGQQDGSAFIYHFNVVEGETYYFRGWTMAGDCNFKLYREDGFNVKSINLEEGSALSISGLGQVEVKFNLTPAFNDVRLVIGRGDWSLKDYCVVQGNTLIIQYAELLKEKMDQNPTLVGEDARIVITGLHEAGNDEMIYGEYGYLVLNYTVAPYPLTLQSDNSQGFTFMSYFIPEGDNGCLILKFDGELMEGTVEAQIVYGNPDGEAGDCWSDYVPASVRNDEVVVNFAGVRRLPEDMLTTGNTYSTMKVVVANIKGTDGQYVYSGGMGTMGTFEYVLPYQVVGTTEVNAVFTPAAGSDLSKEENVTITVSPANAIAFDGVKFTYGDGETVIEKGDLTIANGTDNAVTITAAIPAAAKQAETVVVTLDNFRTADGADHSGAVTAQYSNILTPEELAIVSVVPADGTEMYGLQEDQTITVTLNRPEAVNVMTYQIKDRDNNEIIKAIAYFVKEEDGTFVATLPQDITFYENHNYVVELRGWDSDADPFNGGTPLISGEVVYRGLTEAFQFSNVKLENIDPAAGTILTSVDDRFFTVTFDGYVTIDSMNSQIVLGSGFTQSFDDIQAVDPEENDAATTWRLEVPESIMTSVEVLTLSIKAYDLAGKLVEGNEGENEGSFFYFEYPLNIGAVAPEVNSVITPAEGEVTSLMDFSITFEEVTMVMQSWNGQKITLEDGEGNIVATLTQDDINVVWPDDWSAPINTVTFSLPEEVIEAGNYTLRLAAGMFIFNDGAFSSPEFTYNYTIVSQPTGIEAIIADGNAEIFTLTGVRVNKNASDLTPGLYIINGRKYVVK